MTKVPYIELIGGLLFLSTRMRPDIAGCSWNCGETRI
jgi:hypothetical protein